MPNWCATNIVFYSISKEPINKLNDKLGGIERNPSKTLALPDILNAHGIGRDKCDGRSHIIEVSSPEKVGEYWVLKVYQEDPWGPHTEPWKEILASDLEYEGIDFVYSAFESGNGIYCKTDSAGLFLPGQYMVDACLPGVDGKLDWTTDEFPNEETLLAKLNRYVDGRSFATVQEAKGYFTAFALGSSDPDVYFYLYECEIS